MKAVRVFLTVALVFVLSVTPAWTASAPLGKAVPRTGAVSLGGLAITTETTMFSGDSLATSVDGLAVVQLPMGDQVHLGPETSATLLRYGNDLVVSLDHGMVLAHSGKGQRISVNALGIVITPPETGSFEVAVQNGSVVVAARAGAVEVVGTNRSFVVPATKAMRFETTTDTVARGKTGVGANAIGPGVAAIIAIAIAAGVSIPVALAYANNKAQNACEDAVQSVSPSTPPTLC